MTRRYYLTDMGLVNALGSGQRAVAEALYRGECGLSPCDWVRDKPTYTAPVDAPLAAVPEHLLGHASRNLELAVTALGQIRESVDEAIATYGASRVAVVAGTSTSGIAEGERAVAASERGEPLPPGYHYRAQEIGNLSALVARYCGATGLAYTLSTACSSSAHALASAARLLATGMADAVIAGGADSLCRLTVNGFAALDSVSEQPCSPFSANRRGINIGEAAAFFLVTREPLRHRVRLLGAGASSDAHHISAPEPSGDGAERAIRMALAQADLPPQAVGYVNLHGTGTQLNDAMESRVIHRLFPHGPQASSAKGQLGHTLGAAGATEAALMWLSLVGGDGKLPPHCYDGAYDPELPPLNLVASGERLRGDGRAVFLSNSFAFGGNNAALILGGEGED